MATRLHVLAARITSSVGSFVKGLGVASIATKQLATTWKTAGRDISSSANRIGLAVAALTGLAVKKFADFESAMVSAGAVTRTLGTKRFALLEKQALKMGETTIFTATQSARAIESMGLAGLKTTEIITALPGALGLASAANITISEAATIAAKNMRAFGLRAEELGRINDVLVGTFTRSNTDIRQLAEAFKISAPVAKTMGEEIETVSAILAKMADEGFTGTLAGTALRTSLIRLAAPSSKAKKLLSEFGVVAGQSLLDKLQRISGAMDQMTTNEERLATAAEIFGIRGGPQMLSVFNQGIPAVRKFVEELKKLRGITKEIEEARLKTLTGQFTLVLSAMEGVQIAMGKRLRPEMEALAKSIIKNKDEIAKVAFAFIEWVKSVIALVKEHPRLFKFLALLKVASLLGITAAIGSLATAIKVTLTRAIVDSTTKTILWRRAFLGIGGLVAGGLFLVVILRLQKINAELRKSIDLTSELSTEEERRASERLSKIEQIESVELRIFKLEQERAKVEEKISNFLTASRASMQEANRLSKDLGVTIGTLGGLLFDPEKIERELSEAEKQAANRLAEIAKKFDRAIAKARREQVSGVPPKASRGVTGPGVPVGGGGRPLGQQQRPVKVPFVKTPFGRQINSLNQSLAKGKISLEKFDKEMQKISRLEALNEFRRTRMELISELRQGKITQDQFTQGIIALNRARLEAAGTIAKQRAQVREQAKADFQQRVSEARQTSSALTENFDILRRFGAEAKTKSQSAVDSFNRLFSAVIKGKISQERYAEAVEKLTNATQKAIIAEELARKQRLLKGEGTGEDKAFLKRQIAEAKKAALTEKVNNGFQNMVNKLSGLGDGTKKLKDGFGSLRKGMNNFKDTLGSAAQRVAPTAQQLGRLSAGINNLFGSRVGQVALIRNQISLLQQNLQFQRGRVGSAKRRDQIQNQIRALLSRINQIMRPSTPATIAQRIGVQGLADPGLQRQQSPTTASAAFSGAGSTSIVINTSAMNGRTILKELELELQKRGRRL